MTALYSTAILGRAVASGLAPVDSARALARRRVSVGLDHVQTYVAGSYAARTRQSFEAVLLAGLSLAIGDDLPPAAIGLDVHVFEVVLPVSLVRALEGASDELIGALAIAGLYRIARA